MITFDRVSITYDGAVAPALHDVDLHIPAGVLAVIIGPTGAGKSTLLGAINAHVPRFTGGRLDGRVTVAGRDTAAHHPRDLADVVGVVGQDPLAGFVTETVESELAFGMEQLGLPSAVMRQRVEEVVDLLGLVPLRHRALRTLSGGQQQRVAIGAALALHPEVLVLDEPTSALDPGAAEDVLSAISRLVHDLGITAVVAEHRLERIVGVADLVIEVGIDGTVRAGSPAEIFRGSAVAPPVVELGRLARWDPLPLSVRDARRRAPDLKAGLQPVAATMQPASGRPVLGARGLAVTYAGAVALQPLDVDLRAGEIAGVMGRNGSGKSSLLWALHGAGPRARGTVAIDGVDPAEQGAADARRLVGLVPQTPSDLLYLSTVGQECQRADTDAGGPPGTCAALLQQIGPSVPMTAHPRDLSEGQRLALVLAITMSARPAVLLLDEPTRGLDYSAKQALRRVLRATADAGTAIAVATHDVEFVASACDRVIVLADGDVVADGPTAQIVLASPTLAPQVAKIMRPGPWLTVEQVAAALPAQEDAA